jgi:hypothetical protein
LQTGQVILLHPSSFLTKAWWQFGQVRTRVFVI